MGIRSCLCLFERKKWWVWEEKNVDIFEEKSFSSKSIYLEEKWLDLSGIAFIGLYQSFFRSTNNFFWYRVLLILKINGFDFFCKFHFHLLNEQNRHQNKFSKRTTKYNLLSSFSNVGKKWQNFSQKVTIFDQKVNEMAFFFII